MIDTRIYHGLKLDIARSSSDQICYILLPEGLKEDGSKWMESAAVKFDVSIVAISGMDWNDDLTPWAAEGVFKKEKPFGGHADLFLKDLKDDIFPAIEALIDLKKPQRTLAGISLSGLFAIWSCFKQNFISNIISISGSLWYDDFADWVKERQLSPSVKKIFISLGDREKRSRDRRMAAVEDATGQVVKALNAKGAEVKYLLEENTTHFSPIVPRLEKAFAAMFSTNNQETN